MHITEDTKPQNSFPFLKDVLIKRFMAPVGQVSFWVFFILGILTFSACGIWVELGKYFLSTCKSLDGVQTAIFTFVPAMACTATMQIVFTDNEKKYLKSVGYAVGVVTLLGAIGLLMFIDHLAPEISIPIGVFLSVVAILTWWIANGMDAIFYDNAGQDATTGGDLDKDLPGSVAGFKIK
jgi:hypothetical protein